MPIMAMSRPGVHHGGRDTTLTSEGCRATSVMPVTCGKAEYECQLSHSTTHVPVTSTTQPTLRSARTDLLALTSTRIVSLPHFNVTRAYYMSLDGLSWMVPRMRKVRPWRVGIIRTVPFSSRMMPETSSTSSSFTAVRLAWRQMASERFMR